MEIPADVQENVHGAPFPGDSKPVRLAAIAAGLLFSVSYFVSCAIVSARSSLTTDEIFVTWTLRAFPGRLLEALKSGVDSLPPGYYLLLEAVTRVMGLNALALRLPSIVAFYIFLLSIFWLVRKHVSLPVAVLAMALPCVTGALAAAVLARPYAMVAACFGIAGVLWTRSSAKPASLRRAMALTIVLAIAIGLHFYAVLLVAVLGLAELVRSARDREFRWANWAALAVAGFSVLLWWPVIGPIYRLTHASIHAAGYYAKPTLGALFAKLLELVVGQRSLAVLLALVCLALGLLRQCQPPSGPARNRPDAVDDSTALSNLDILAFAALTLPFTTFIFALAVTGSFNTRHFYAAVLGISLLAARALRQFRYANGVSFFVLLLIVATFANNTLRGAPGEDPRIAVAERSPEHLPVVLGDASDFFELRESAPPGLRDRLVFVGMPAGFSSPDPEPEMVAWIWKGILKDMPVFHAEDWFAGAPRFYVLCTGGNREGLTDWLIHHATVTVARRESGMLLLEVKEPHLEAR
jgi:hypothetical protein